MDDGREFDCGPGGCVAAPVRPRRVDRRKRAGGRAQSVRARPGIRPKGMSRPLEAAASGFLRPQSEHTPSSLSSPEAGRLAPEEINHSISP